MRSAKLAVLRLAKLFGGFRLARWLTGRYLKILCYHGFELADEAAFRPKLFITADQFDRRLATIRQQGYRVIPLADAIDRLYRGTLPRHAVAITVDDGFQSFHRVGVPLLMKYGFPATVYVTTYYVRHRHPIFRLAVQYMFWRAPKRRVALKGLRWTTDREVDLANTPQTDEAMWECIRFGETRCTEAERDVLARQVGELLDVSFDAIRASEALTLMGPEELRSLKASAVDVELHTHRHVFPGNDRAAAEREIVDNRDALREWVPHQTTHFCYPSGAWTPLQWAWLRDLGIRSATTCDPGLNSAATPPHALFRFLDGEEVHPLEFESALSGFSDVVRSLRSGRLPLVPRARSARGPTA